MDTNKSVTVLTPNARRPIIKVSPNTTILQVLEEACIKHNFNSDEYDLKYHNKVLDVNLVFRYANIANNACLEMVPCKNARKLSSVIICIQLENGTRISGEFASSVNISSILKHLDIEYHKNITVIIYLQREIHGEEFENVTLRSLGLSGGKALFRLLQRDREKLKEQAHVYVPPRPKPLSEDESYPKHKCKSPSKLTLDSKTLDPFSVVKTEIIKETDSSQTQKYIKANAMNLNSNKTEDVKNKDSVAKVHIDYETEASSSLTQEPKVEFLGERNALLFNQAGAKAAHQDNVDDDFFELTVKDATILLRDSKRKQEELINAPLQTSSQRELERNKSQLNTLHKYHKAIIRIQFANQLVLQGLFKPHETVQTIKDFIKTYLEHPEADFILYTSPPRCDLIPSACLLDCELVPSAIIYYSGGSDLKFEIKAKLTDPEIVTLQAVKTRGECMRKYNTMQNDEKDTLHCCMESSSSENSNNSNIMTSLNRIQPDRSPKAPKWYKPSSK